MRHPVYPKDSTFGPFPSPGLNATQIVWDDTRAAIGRPSAPPSDSHVRVAFLFDQIVTFIVKWAPAQDAPDSALKVVNGPVVGSVHAGVATVVNYVLFSRCHPATRAESNFCGCNYCPDQCVHCGRAHRV